MKRFENAIRNLNNPDIRMVPQVSAWTINCAAQETISVVTRQVAGNTAAGDSQVKGIPLRLVCQHVRVFKASPSGKMAARIRVNWGNLPAIKLGTARVRLAWCSGKLQYHGSVPKVGKYLFWDALIQQPMNDRWHVTRRIDGRNYCLIGAMETPLSGSPAQVFENVRNHIVAAGMLKQLGCVLKQQLRLRLIRWTDTYKSAKPHWHVSGNSVETAPCFPMGSRHLLMRRSYLLRWCG